MSASSSPVVLNPTVDYPKQMSRLLLDWMRASECPCFDINLAAFIRKAYLKQQILAMNSEELERWLKSKIDPKAMEALPASSPPAEDGSAPPTQESAG